MDDAVGADLRAGADRHVREDDGAIADRRALANRRRTRRSTRPRRAAHRRRPRRARARRAPGARRARTVRTARANARYGSRVRSIAHGAGGASSLQRGRPRPASCASAVSYFGLARKVTSPGSASWMPATRTISISPSPSRRQARRSASSRSFTMRKIVSERVRAGVHERSIATFEEFREMLQAQAGGDVVNPRLARRRLQHGDVAQLAQRRTRAPGPRDAVQTLRRAAHGQPVTDHAKREVAAQGRLAMPGTSRNSRPNGTKVSTNRMPSTTIHRR